MNNETLAFAYHYLEMGLRPFPLAPRSKVPPKGFPLKRYQTQQPTAAEVRKWFSSGEANIGLLLGRGLMAVDFDGEGSEQLLADAGVELPDGAPCVRTANGFHVFLRVSGPIPNAVELLASEERKPGSKKPLCQVDIRADGGYVVTAPSVHPSGHIYEWVHRLGPDIPEAPAALLSLIRQKSSNDAAENRPGAVRNGAAASDAPKWVVEALRGARQGLRDTTCTKLAGYFLGKRIPKDIVLQQLTAWATLCKPPFPLDQVEKCVASVQRKDTAAKAPPEGAAPAPVGSGEFQILGYNQGHYYYLPRDSQQVIELRRDQHTKLHLLGLADLGYWEHAYPGDHGPKWDMAANALLRLAAAAGVYDTSRIRGRGAWWDEDPATSAGAAILHVGDALIVEGQRAPLRVGRYIYEAAAPIDVDTASPLTSDEANQLAQVAELVSWKRPISARLFSGWCAVAPICGALSWRPHIWITAAAGSGKSWVIDHVARRLLRTIGLPVQSETTEAGLRQTLGHDARPITFDEIEGHDERAKQRVQNVLALARQASSETGAVIIKGSPLGTAKTYRIRSCFAFSSIGVGVDKHADATRVSVLEIERYPGTAEDRKQHFSRLQALAGETITEEYSRRFIARSIALAPVIRANAQTFASAGAAVIGSQRLGDQIGALLAGAYSLYHNGPINPEDARAWIEAQDWTEQQDTQDSTDELLCLQRILEHVLPQVQSGMFRGPRSVGELVKATELLKDPDVKPDDANAALARIGIRVDRGAADANYLTISSSHTAIADILRGTNWCPGWGRVLRRLAGAMATTEAVRFGSIRSRGIEIPLEAIE